MFSGVPQTTQSRKFTVEKDKDSDTLPKIPRRRRLTCLGVPRLSSVFVMSLTIVFALIGSKVSHDPSS